MKRQGTIPVAGVTEPCDQSLPSLVRVLPRPCVPLCIHVCGDSFWSFLLSGLCPARHCPASCSCPSLLACRPPLRQRPSLEGGFLPCPGTCSHAGGRNAGSRPRSHLLLPQDRFIPICPSGVTALLCLMSAVLRTVAPCMLSGFISSGTVNLTPVSIGRGKRPRVPEAGRPGKARRVCGAGSGGGCEAPLSLQTLRRAAGTPAEPAPAPRPPQGPPVRSGASGLQAAAHGIFSGAACAPGRVRAEEVPRPWTRGTGEPAQLPRACSSLRGWRLNAGRSREGALRPARCDLSLYRCPWVPFTCGASELLPAPPATLRGQFLSLLGDPAVIAKAAAAGTASGEWDPPVPAWPCPGRGRGEHGPGMGLDS